jgi:hypothetical protein
MARQPPAFLRPLVVLRACPEGQVTFTFEQVVEAFLGTSLPVSARRYGSWWHDTSHRARRWRASGWTLSCSLTAQTVTFTRAAATAP